MPASALHRQAGQILVLEAIAHIGRCITVTEAHETGAVENLAVLLKPLDIGTEVAE